MGMKTLLAASLAALVTSAVAASAAPQVTIQSAQLASGKASGDAVKSETLKFEPFKGELALPKARLYTGRSSYRDIGHGPRGHVGYAHVETGVTFRHGRRYVDLVGDRKSGLGFYPLPASIQAGAERYRLAHSYYGPYGNPVQQAVIDDSVRSWAWTPTSAVNGYRYGVYDPIDGVGTPFFAGYYSAGTRDASDDDEPLFGRPIN
ncbi:hypothetical protein [Methyloferula stellata]|uniref:hypothetical protein n=1 Tax=Methyloferula stellata TaxID=876270 RepID=UPI0012691DAD|nr:hypothetical protein [Methyloferula stellata]